MQIVLEVPEELASKIAGDAQGLSRAALEALALESVRSGKLSDYQARVLLGIPSMYEMDAFLKAHGVMIPYTLAEVKEEMERAAPFLK